MPGSGRQQPSLASKTASVEALSWRSRDRLLFGAAGAALIAVALGAWLLLAPAPSAAPGVDLAAGLGPLSPTAVPLAADRLQATAAPLLVDVEGGVARPGIVRLPAEARGRRRDLRGGRVRAER